MEKRKRRHLKRNDKNKKGESAMKKKLLVLLTKASILCNIQAMSELQYQLQNLNESLIKLSKQLSPVTYNQQRQVMYPSTIWQHLASGKELNRREKIQQFINDTAAFKNENAKIPAHVLNPKTIRIMTHNVHYWTDPFEKQNFDTIFATIQAINPDILLLQEVSLKPMIQKFRDHGYTYGGNSTFCKAADLYGAPFGNMILSKYPFTDIAERVYTDSFGAENRCYTQAVIKLPNNKSISVYVTHFDVFDNSGKTRLNQAKELITDVNKDKHENILIAADFNSVRKNDYQYSINNKLVWNLLRADNEKRQDPTPTDLLELIESHNFIDSFSLLHVPGPKFTTWSGVVIDFIYLSYAWSIPVIGSYVYYDSASDHLPVIIDLKVE